jgi:hypothetical protein
MVTLSAISWRSSDGRSMKGDSILEVVDRCASSVGSLGMGEVMFEVEGGWLCEKSLAVCASRLER